MAMDRWLIATGAIVMALAVASGAYAAHAAHAAANADARRLLDTAVLYMLVHGLGILIAGIVARAGASGWLAAAATFHLAGIVLFCGSLWILALAGRSLGVAPVGGVAFIAGWICLAIHGLRAP